MEDKKVKAVLSIAGSFGIEVYNITDDHILFKFTTPGSRMHQAKVNHLGNRPYFKSYNTRYYLDDFMKV